MLRINTMYDCDTVNAEGISSSLFFQGCTHHCKGCFNSETWSFDGGTVFTEELQKKFINYCNKDYITCIALLGGEPLQQPINDLIVFLEKLKKIDKPILMWSGYTFAEIDDDKDKRKVLDYIDVLIDGPFQEALRDTTIKLRGSRNQGIWRKKEGAWYNSTFVV